MFVNLIAPVNQLGYGVTGFNVLKGLHDAGHTVAYFPIGEPKWADGHKNIIEQAMKNAVRYDKDAPCIRIWHQHQLDKFVGSGERIGWPIFELDTFTEDEMHQLNSVDRLFVCSEWAKDVLIKNGAKVPINVIPLGVDTELFFEDEAAEKTKPYWTKDTTVFINVGKWEVRKGHKELCDAFSKAFTPQDNVELWMLNKNDFIGPRGNEQWKRLYISSPMGQKIKHLKRQPTQAGLREIFNHADVGVFPSHAEGWNLEILELMACGARIVATNYSGHTEFVNKDNALLIEPTGMESAQDGVWFHGQGNWSTFNVDDLVDAMRAAHDERQSGTTVDTRSTVERFTWKNTVKSIEKAL